MYINTNVITYICAICTLALLHTQLHMYTIELNLLRNENTHRPRGLWPTWTAYYSGLIKQ